MNFERIIDSMLKVARVTTSFLVLGSISLTALALSKAAIKDLSRKSVPVAPKKPEASAQKKSAKPKTSGK